MARRKAPGRYCWSCDRRRPNEHFSGKGHARCLCKDCQKLGFAELAYRQAQRDLSRCVTIDGIVTKRGQKQLHRFLEHSDARIRELVREIQQRDTEIRHARRSAWVEELEPPFDAIGEIFVDESWEIDFS